MCYPVTLFVTSSHRQIHIRWYSNLILKPFILNINISGLEQLYKFRHRQTNEQMDTLGKYRGGLQLS